MIKQSFAAAAVAAVAGLSAPALAQQAPYGPAGQPVMPQQGMGNAMPWPQQAPMQGQFIPPMMVQPPAAIGNAPPMMARFPTPQELQQLTPPEPLTEEQIRKRFEQRKKYIREMMERDRKAAEKYAQDFARYQKYQAEQLAEMMKRAEEHRKAVLERIDREMEQALKQFQQRQKDTQAAQKAPADKP